MEHTEESMASHAPDLPMNIVVTFEHRADGGLRAYSDSLPGFALSNRDPEVVKGSVAPVLEVMLGSILGRAVRVCQTTDVGEFVNPKLPHPSITSAPVNYVGLSAN